MKSKIYEIYAELHRKTCEICSDTNDGFVAYHSDYRDGISSVYLFVASGVGVFSLTATKYKGKWSTLLNTDKNDVIGDTKLGKAFSYAENRITELEEIIGGKNV